MFLIQTLPFRAVLLRLLTNFNSRMTEEAQQMAVNAEAAAQAESDASQPQPQVLTTDEALPASQAGSSHAAEHQNYSLAPVTSQTSDPHNWPAGSQQHRPVPGRLPPLPPYPNPYTNSARNSNTSRSTRRIGSIPNGSRVVGSPTGGVQVRLDGPGDWSELARQDATLPTDAAVGRLLGDSSTGAPGGSKGDSSGNGGVFGFLSRKKGRGSSPKPKERGVLGKEGARVVIG